VLLLFRAAQIPNTINCAALNFSDAKKYGNDSVALEKSAKNMFNF